MRIDSSRRRRTSVPDRIRRALKMPFPQLIVFCFFFFFNDPATTEIYTLSLHDALPISVIISALRPRWCLAGGCLAADSAARSEEHTSELQSQSNIVCRLLLEKKKR